MQLKYANMLAIVVHENMKLRHNTLNNERLTLVNTKFLPKYWQITAKHQDCPFFTVFLITYSLSQNISITLLQISLKLHERRGCYWRKQLSRMILEEQFLVPRYTAASKIANSVISLLWQLRWRCNPDHNKFPSSSNTTVLAIFPKLCLWRRSLCSNLGGIGPEKLYRATLNKNLS